MIARAGLVVALGAAALAAGQAAGQGAGGPCDACGVIKLIEQVQVRQEWTPLGAVSPGSRGVGGLGGASGASTQMSFGRGFSNQGLVIVGAAGGAAYAQKPNEYNRPNWEVTVKLDSGPTRVVTLKYEPLLVQEGDRVRISGNNVELVDP